MERLEISGINVEVHSILQVRCQDVLRIVDHEMLANRDQAFAGYGSTTKIYKTGDTKIAALQDAITLRGFGCNLRCRSTCGMPYKIGRRLTVLTCSHDAPYLTHSFVQ
jgi:hypothetical protein